MPLRNIAASGQLKAGPARVVVWIRPSPSPERLHLTLRTILAHTGEDCSVVVSDPIVDPQALEAVIPPGRTVLVVSGGDVAAASPPADVVVVDTPDAVLITTRARAQQVKQVVAGLQATDKGELT